MPQQAISTRIAQIYKTTYGRGPTKITAYLLPDLVTVLVEDLNIPAQSTLVELGDHDLVEAGHRRLHQVMCADMCTAIEEILQRRVRGCVSGFNVALDAATNCFPLEDGDVEAG
ncbi:MAG: DUF2294 family protein [Patulibacter sp.]|nr:DUF2294 family protein [Patulibacter sp.]